MKKFFLTLLTLCTLLLCSCKKDIDTIGLNLQNGTLGNAYIEVPLSAHSSLEDSIYTKNLLYTLLGEIHDPVFGTTGAGFCSQFDLQGSNTHLGDNLELDSVILTLQYAGYYGDTLSGLRLEVYELSEDLTRAQYYSTDNNPSHQGINLVYSTAPVLPTPTTRVKVDTLNYSPHMRIRLTNAFGTRLLNFSSSELNNTSSFQAAFKGLVVKATANGTGNLCYFNPASAMTGLTLYYKADGETKKYTFPVSTECTRYNFFTHDYSCAEANFQRQVINGDSSLGGEVLYVQPTGGVKTHVDLTKLTEWSAGKNIIINKAELVITNLNPSETELTPPSNLGLQRILSDGTATYLPDDAVYTSTSYFGGSYDSGTKEYRFRVTYYIQELLRNGQINDKGINIVSTGSGVRGNRLVFRGTDESYTDRLKLAIYYTEY